MKVVQVQTQAEAGGAQRTSQHVAEGLLARGHSVTTVYLYRKTAAYDDDATAAFMLPEAPHSPVDLATAVVRLCRFVRKAQPDAMILYQHYGNIAGTIAAKFAGCRRVVANQNGLPGGVGIPDWATAVDRMIGSAGWYGANVVKSGLVADAFRDYPRRYRDALVRISHGVLVPQPRISKAEARQRLGVPEGVPLVVSSGRLAPQKNQMKLVEALPELGEAHLAIAGQGPLREDLLRRAAELGVPTRLHLAGEVSPHEIADFLVAGDVYAFPSVWETFGQSVVEGAMMGLPVACSDLPVFREVLRVAEPDGEYAAVFFDNSDPRAVAASISSVLNDASLAGALSRTGRLLRAQYSVSALVDEYERLIQ